MGRLLSKLDVIALTASGEAAEKLLNFLRLAREDIADNSALFHKGVVDIAEANADATDLPTALTLVNSLKTKIGSHLASAHSASEGIAGAHVAASAASIAAADATDQATAETLANEIKADYNTHLTEAGVHLNNDTTNAVSSADASDLASLLTLVNEIKADWNAHILSGLSAPFIGI